MSITIVNDSHKHEVKSFLFSDGEIQTQVGTCDWCKMAQLPIQIIARLQSPQDALELIMAHEVLGRLAPKAPELAELAPFAIHQIRPINLILTLISCF